jgi:hypothetical protein
MTDINIMKNKIEELTNKILELEKENFELKEHLKKYTAPSRSKKYYENNKEKLLNKMKETGITSEKRKEYNKKYYLKKKEELQNIFEK